MMLVVVVVREGGLRKTNSCYESENGSSISIVDEECHYVVRIKSDFTIVE